MAKKEKIVIVSGYFNPMHAGHVSMFQDAKRLGDRLVVIVNNDEQVKIKGTFPFMSVDERKRIVGAIKYVDLVYISNDKDDSVCKTIQEVYELLKEDASSFVFANGGDRKKGNVPEYDICKKLGIELAFNIGSFKQQSSSWLIQNAKRCDKHGEVVEYCKTCIKDI